MNRHSLQIFVLNVPEFASLTAAARRMPECRVDDVGDYVLISSDAPIAFERRALGL